MYVRTYVNNPTSMFENIVNMHFMLKQLQLPNTIFIDLFFALCKILCKDCLHLRYPKHNDYEPIKICDLYCTF